MTDGDFYKSPHRDASINNTIQAVRRSAVTVKTERDCVPTGRDMNTEFIEHT